MKRCITVILGIFLILVFLLGQSNKVIQKRAYLALTKKHLSNQTDKNIIDNNASENTPVLDVFGINSNKSPFSVSTEPGEPGYGLDIMSLIKYTDPKSDDARKYKEVIELYYKASKGELDSASFHLTPQTYAAMHRIETTNRTFLDGYYGKPRGKYSAADMTLSSFTGKMMTELGIYGSGGVFKDANGDGKPDGPFQIERGINVAASIKSKMNGVGQGPERDFDVVYFPDQLSWINYTFSDLVSELSLSFADSREVAMYAVAKHNRGSVIRQAYGIPYNTQGLAPINNYITASSTEVYKESRVLFQDLLRMFQKFQPAIKNIDTTTQISLGIFLALKSGWFIDSELGDITKIIDASSSQKYFEQIFPEATGEIPSKYLTANFVMKPWEVVGITKEDFGRIYGMNRDKYSNYYNHTFLFKVEEYTSSVYNNKMPDGSDPKVIHAWDYIPIGYSVAAGIFGETILLDLFVKAGLPEEVDGMIIDPTNPLSAYQIMKNNNAKSYNPSDNNSETDDNFNKLLSMLEISANPERLKSLYHTYENLGMKYWFGSGGLKINNLNYNTHASWKNLNDYGSVSGNEYLDSYFYQTKDGSRYIPGVTKDEDLLYRDIRIFDCAKLVMSGPSLGQTRGDVLYYNQNSKGIISGVKHKGEEVREINGIDYDTGWYIASKGGNKLSEYKNDSSLVQGGLQPGDILVREGHAFTVLCISPKDITLPANIACSGANVNISAGSLVTFEAWSSGEYNRVRDRGWGDNNSYYVVRVHMFDK